MRNKVYDNKGELVERWVKQLGGSWVKQRKTSDGWWNITIATRGDSRWSELERQDGRVGR
jgi:hypothetical protein